ncbi:hypothetical protein [uncultured Amaricoccus sp.]|uniref:hypothetical protein n=1 Tax=uncultured Amaricoccus sp. TaxID=339341 RepID=UPI0026251025|nr:hypothetical protein [uncultured Amaricoccus sp.]
MICDLVARFQTLIAASIALVGVIATLAANAHAGRKQSERHWAKEAASVRIALRGEIEQLKRWVTGQRERLQEMTDQENGGFLVPSRSIDVVYRSLIPQLGRLEANQVEAVMDVYGQYGTYLDKLQVVGLPHRSGQYTEISNQWRSVVAAHCEYVTDKADSALRVL